MEDIVESLARILDIDSVSGWGGEELADTISSLSLAARSSFEFEGVSFLGERMACARPLIEMRPSALVTQIKSMEESIGRPVICILDKATPYLRRIMLEGGVAFASADGQAFVPGLLRLKAQRAAAPKPKRTSMTPSAKLAFAYRTGHVAEDITVADLAAATGMSRSTGKRALEEVRSVTPLARRMGGPKSRTAIYRVDDPQEFTEEGSAVFGEAISKRFFVSLADAAGLPLGGLSAILRTTTTTACWPRARRLRTSTACRP